MRMIPLFVPSPTANYNPKNYPEIVQKHSRLGAQCSQLCSGCCCCSAYLFLIKINITITYKIIEKQFNIMVGGSPVRFRNASRCLWNMSFRRVVCFHDFCLLFVSRWGCNLPPLLPLNGVGAGWG